MKYKIIRSNDKCNIINFTSADLLGECSLQISPFVPYSMKVKWPIAHKLYSENAFSRHSSNKNISSTDSMSFAL